MKTKAALPAIWQTGLTKYSELVNQYYITVGENLVLERAME